MHCVKELISLCQIMFTRTGGSLQNGQIGLKLNLTDSEYFPNLGSYTAIAYNISSSSISDALSSSGRKRLSIEKLNFTPPCNCNKLPIPNIYSYRNIHVNSIEYCCSDYMAAHHQFLEFGIELTGTSMQTIIDNTGILAPSLVYKMCEHGKQFEDMDDFFLNNLDVKSFEKIKLELQHTDYILEHCKVRKINNRIISPIYISSYMKNDDECFKVWLPDVSFRQLNSIWTSMKDVGMTNNVPYKNICMQQLDLGEKLDTEQNSFNTEKSFLFAALGFDWITGCAFAFLNLELCYLWPVTSLKSMLNDLEVQRDIQDSIDGSFKTALGYLPISLNSNVSFNDHTGGGIPLSSTAKEHSILPSLKVESLGGGVMLIGIIDGPWVKFKQYERKPVSAMEHASTDSLHQGG